MKRALALTALLFVSTAHAQKYYAGPAGWLSKTKNQATWAKYCAGTAASAQRPRVNYANPEVQRAALILSKVANLSFYFYGPIVKAYGLVGPDKKLVRAPADAPKGTSRNAHAFLVQLCGEFRDRAGLVAAKVRWVNNLFTLPTTPQGAVDYRYNVWSQLSAHSYAPYLELSRQLFAAKRAAAGNPFPLGSYTVDMPVPGQTICETKYMIGEYVAKGRPFDNLQAFQAGVRDFAQKGYCTKDDLEWYHDFRGDSNFKPQSPESNGMLWYGNSIAGHCKDTVTAKDTKVTSADCEYYFRNPFRSRWNAARAGLATWIFYDAKYDSTFGGSGSTVIVRPHREGYRKPFGFSFTKGEPARFEFLAQWGGAGWTAFDMGFNRLTGLGAAGANTVFAYERLRDDGIGMYRNQAYSPFVASSYEMSKSDHFTSPGTTVSSPSDGRKHWMFIFRVRNQDWYNSARVARGEPVDFDRHWFDETSLGTVGLAKAERAWDRMGTALEWELDSIVYLHNITTSGTVATGGTP
jgi:hypothetical protein